MNSLHLGAVAASACWILLVGLEDWISSVKAVLPDFVFTTSKMKLGRL